MSQSLKKVKLKIHGMHCANCEILVERKFKKIPGIEKVKANHPDGKAEIYCSQGPHLLELNNAVQPDGYTVSLWEDRNADAAATPENSKKDYVQIGVIFLIIMAVYLIFKQFDIAARFGISENMSYGFVFLIGLVAAMSTCLAVTGGLLLAVAAKYNERFADLSGAQKFKPHLYFNLGRLVSYTVFGGIVGAIGSVLAFSPRATGFITITVSIVMIIFGFQLLHVFPWMSRFQPKMPKFLAHKIHDLSGKNSKFAPLLLGASTFFLPCGFTQALQLYVLASGDWKVGALTMFVFSLGTLPALMSLSAISSFAKKRFQQYFIKFAGVAVVLIGVFNMNNGVALTGSHFDLTSIFLPASGDTAKQQEQSSGQKIDGKQIIDMQVVGLDYFPHQFTVEQGVPVEWRIDASRAQGCAQVISVPKLGIVEYLPPQTPTVITFTPQQIGTIEFSCTMGMTTRGSKFTIVSNTAETDETDTKRQPPKKQVKCNPEVANCLK